MCCLLDPLDAEPTPNVTTYQLRRKPTSQPMFVIRVYHLSGNPNGICFPSVSTDPHNAIIVFPHDIILFLFLFPPPSHQPSTTIPPLPAWTYSVLRCCNRKSNNTTNTNTTCTSSNSNSNHS